MGFDPKIHDVKILIIKCGHLLYPDEKDVTTLYKKASSVLGVPEIQTTSIQADHLPAPHEMMKPETVMEGKSGYVIPRQDCPLCGGKNTVALVSLCTGCAEAEGGKYRTMWFCLSCQKHKDKSDKPMVKWLEELDIEFSNQTKKSLGIETFTDEGLK